LDAAFFHLYLPSNSDGQWQFLDTEPLANRHSLLAAFPTPRDAVSYIMDTFPIVKRKDEEKFNGDYRTKRTILKIYDEMAECQRTGAAFVSPLNPEPAGLTAAHPWTWEGKPLELPVMPRTALPESWQYVVNVLVELLWQNGGSLSWTLLRAATELLSDRHRIATLAEPKVGKVARNWLTLDGDSFDAEHRWDQLSGFCHAGKMRVTRRSGELCVDLLSVEGHLLFPHVRFDARLALTVARSLPATIPMPAEAREEERIAELIPA
jgi:hypothetical protein